MSVQSSTSEKAALSVSGYFMLAIIILLFLISIVGLTELKNNGSFASIVPPFFLILAIFLSKSFYILEPNEAAVLSLFGNYSGTDRSDGLRWANPLATRQKISLRARTIESSLLKVNDKRGNPIEIGAVIVWKVSRTAQAIFDVDNFESYVRTSTEAAIRHLATQFAYDEGSDLQPNEPTLRGGLDSVANTLEQDLLKRCAAAGVSIVEARISHLAYAPEIAHVMLRKQQAEATINARQKIVLNAVAMVQTALNQLTENGLVELDSHHKAAMVSNLLVVLCSNQEVQPTVSTTSV